MSRQQAAILKMLQDAGPAGVLNTALNQVAFRYGARIFELGEMGYRIVSSAVDAAHGLYRYRLENPGPLVPPALAPVIPRGDSGELFEVQRGAYGTKIVPTGSVSR